MVGAPPRWPGRGDAGGGRKSGDGERDGDARPDLGMKAFRDFDPTVDQPIWQFGPPPSLF